LTAKSWALWHRFASDERISDAAKPFPCDKYEYNSLVLFSIPSLFFSFTCLVYQQDDGVALRMTLQSLNYRLVTEKFGGN
jgi:hypothetical protein